ncbi:MAG: hypothetical protein QM689_08530 [Oscillospiraceae bacterium]
MIMEYTCLPVCDLRQTTLAAAKNITKISSCATVIFPTDADEETMTALSVIPLECVAAVMHIGKNALISEVNGINQLSDTSFSGGSDNVVVSNGISVAMGLSELTEGNLFVNGMAIFPKKLEGKLRLRTPMVNGGLFYMDYEDFKFYATTMTLDAQLMKYLPEKTLIVCGDTLEIDDSVTEEMMADKKVLLCAGNMVRCRKEISGYVKAFSQVGNTIEII